jgi:hypothetical protein
MVCPARTPAPRTCSKFVTAPVPVKSIIWSVVDAAVENRFDSVEDKSNWWVVPETQVEPPPQLMHKGELVMPPTVPPRFSTLSNPLSESGKRSANAGIEEGRSRESRSSNRMC